MEPTGQPLALIPTNIDSHLAARPEVDGEAFRADLAEAFEVYASRWWGWAEQKKPRRRVIDLYGSFFALKQQMEMSARHRARALAMRIGRGCCYPMPACRRRPRWKPVR